MIGDIYEITRPIGWAGGDDNWRGLLVIQTDENLPTFNFISPKPKCWPIHEFNISLDVIASSMTKVAHADQQ